MFFMQRALHESSVVAGLMDDSVVAGLMDDIVGLILWRQFCRDLEICISLALEALPLLISHIFYELSNLDYLLLSLNLRPISIHKWTQQR